MEKALLSSGSGKVKETWESGNNFKFDKDYQNYPYGYPWPPRCYSCTFCQREFKSAQALGGHMNIHRRDRARLRDQSPNNNPNPNPNIDQCPSSNPNPNPNYPNPISFSPSSNSPTTNNIYAHQYSLVSLSLSSLPPSTKNGEKLNLGGDFDQGFGNCKDLYSLLGNHHPHHEVRVFKSTTSSTEEFVKLDLELCLGEAKEELDLELRLGI